MSIKLKDTAGIVPTSNRKIVERSKVDTPNTQIQDCSLFWLDTVYSIKKNGVLKEYYETSLLSGMMRSSKSFPHASYQRANSVYTQRKREHHNLEHYTKFI